MELATQDRKTFTTVVLLQPNTTREKMQLNLNYRNKIHSKKYENSGTCGVLTKDLILRSIEFQEERRMGGGTEKVIKNNGRKFPNYEKIYVNF